VSHAQCRVSCDLLWLAGSSGRLPLSGGRLGGIGTVGGAFSLCLRAQRCRMTLRIFSERSSGESLAAVALPPRRSSATAAGFFPLLSIADNRYEQRRCRSFAFRQHRVKRPGKNRTSPRFGTFRAVRESLPPTRRIRQQSRPGFLLRPSSTEPRLPIEHR
jgi:hypothetical protein